MAYHTKHLDFGADAGIPEWCIVRTDEIVARRGERSGAGSGSDGARGAALILGRLRRMLADSANEEETLRAVLTGARERTRKRYENIVRRVVEGL